LAEPVEGLRSSFVGSIKHMPLRYKLKPADWSGLRSTIWAALQQAPVFK